MASKRKLFRVCATDGMLLPNAICGHSKSHRGGESVMCSERFNTGCAYRSLSVCMIAGNEVNVGDLLTFHNAPHGEKGGYLEKGLVINGKSLAHYVNTYGIKHLEHIPVDKLVSVGVNHGE